MVHNILRYIYNVARQHCKILNLFQMFQWLLSLFPRQIPARLRTFLVNWVAFVPVCRMPENFPWNIAKILMDDVGIDPDRIGIAGYADRQPRAANNTSEGRALNRRVEIQVKYD